MKITGLFLIIILCACGKAINTEENGEDLVGDPIEERPADISAPTQEAELLLPELYDGCSPQDPNACNPRMTGLTCSLPHFPYVHDHYPYHFCTRRCEIRNYRQPPENETCLILFCPPTLTCFYSRIFEPLPRICAQGSCHVDILCDYDETWARGYGMCVPENYEEFLSGYF